MNNVILVINNYGVIKEANLELNKLNVIAGENGSGKSTLSKLLSCFIIASFKEGEYLANSSIGNRFKLLVLNIYEEISKKFGDDENLNKLLLILDNFPSFNDKSFNEYIDIHLNDLEKILKEFQIDDNDFNHFKKLFDNHVDENRRYFNISNILLSSEFNFFELNLSDNFKVNFYGKNDDCEFSHEMLFNEID